MRRTAMALGALGALLVGAVPPPAERVVGGDAMIAVTIDGCPFRFRVEPGVPGLPLVNPARARELGLKGGGLLAFGVGYRIGRERFYGRTQSVKLGWDGTSPEGRRVGWMSRDYDHPADGTLGPGSFPEPVVRFQLRTARPGEQVVALPFATESGLGATFFGSWFVLDGTMTVAGTPIRVRFDPYHPQTLVTAPAALALARANDGRMTAETGRQEIAFGVERPYRILKLARPLTLGGLALARLGVRVTDEDVAGRIAEAGAPVADADPDEVMQGVVVTARQKRKPRTGLLLIGADALARCSSIVFDKPGKRILLSCGG